MIRSEKLELELAIQKRKEFCTTAIAKYKNRLPKRLFVALIIGVVYAIIRINIDREEKISFYTTLILIVLFCFIVIIIDHIRLIRSIKKDLKAADEQMKILESHR